MSSHENSLERTVRCPVDHNQDINLLPSLVDEVASYDSSDVPSRPDPKPVVLDLLRNPERTDTTLDTFLGQQAAYLAARFHSNESNNPRPRVQLEYARAYRQVTLAPLAHLTVLEVMRSESGAREEFINRVQPRHDTTMEQFNAQLRAILAIATQHTAAFAENGIYLRLWERFYEATRLQRGALRPNASTLSFEVPIGQPETTYDAFNGIFSVTMSRRLKATLFLDG